MTATIICTADTELYSVNPTTNYGSATSITLHNSSLIPARNGLLMFAGLPTGNVQSAVLRLYVSSVPLGCTFKVTRIRRSDWVEGEATWNNYKTASAWSTGGAQNTTNDIWNTDLASSAYIGSTGWASLTLGAAEVNLLCATNYGMALIANNTTDPGPITFNSKEGANPPQLVLTMPGGDVCFF